MADQQSSAAGEGLNRATLGKTYEFGPVTVDAETIRLYTEATNDKNPRYLDPEAPGGMVAPPLFLVRPARDPLFAAMLDPEVGADMVRLLHGEQDMRFHELLRPGDAIRTVGRIAEIIDKETGQILDVKIDFFRGEELVAEGNSILFIRAKHPPKRPKKAKKEPPPEPKWDFQRSVQVAADQSKRYAEASLDRNPIHLDPAVAEKAGLKGIILHGLCTMAFCQHALVNELAEGDPARLSRMRVRFSRPVFMGDVVTVQGVKGVNGEVAFRAVNQDGVEVITGGQAWLR